MFLDTYKVNYKNPITLSDTELKDYIHNLKKVCNSHLDTIEELEWLNDAINERESRKESKKYKYHPEKNRIDFYETKRKYIEECSIISIKRTRDNEVLIFNKDEENIYEKILEFVDDEEIALDIIDWSKEKKYESGYNLKNFIIEIVE